MDQESKHVAGVAAAMVQKKRETRSVFRTLFFSMMLFGVFVGTQFPLFTNQILHTTDALSPVFYLLCVGAGLVVGLFNFFLFKIVVSKELSRLLIGMRKINESMDQALHAQKQFELACALEVNSNDLIGDVAQTFNNMSVAIAERINQESLVRTLMADLSSTVDPKRVAQNVLEAVLKVSESEGGLLFSLQGEEFELLSSVGLDEGVRLPANLDELSEVAVRLIKKGEVAELAPHERGLEMVRVKTPAGQVRPNFFVLVPLVTGSRTVGIIVLPGLRTSLVPARLQLIDVFRTHVAPYLHNALLHRKIGEMAALDWLTRILNRRFGMRRLREEFSRSLRHGLALSVILLDIDHFKKVNDTYGHAAGDAVLKEVANQLKKNIRSGETVCRYGGEEFMVLAPGNDLHDGSVLCERIRKLIENTVVRWAGKDLRVTVSLGVATWPVIPASVVNEIVSAADEALYFAKEAGRNRVAIHQGDDVRLYVEPSVASSLAKI